MTGLFLVVEGPEGAGKTTLARRLAARIRERELDVVEVREPGGTPLAEGARRLALDPEFAASPAAELFLMLAARADLVSKVIQPALDRGRVVVSDRYELSTRAYQVAGRGFPRDAVLEANRLATGGLRPDVTLVLDVPPAVGLARRAAHAEPPDRMEREDRTLHERVRAAFRSATGTGVVHLDAQQAVEAVEAAAWEVVEAKLTETFGSGGGLNRRDGVYERRRSR